jgi:anti-anti-sigma factor
MELTRIDRGDQVEVVASGRLDERWSGHLADSLNQVIRDGSHRIRLNLAAVSYVSSAGIRVLITLYKQLGEIGGSFAIVEPSENVRTILDLTRLTPMLMGGTLAPGLVETPPPPVERVERANSVYEIFDRAIEGAVCRIIGDPALLASSGYGKEHAHAATFDRHTVALGLGAFGAGFDDCRERYGEFLAVAGTAVYLPTDGSSVPDYLAASQDYVPQVSVLYGLACRGRFSVHMRFQASNAERRIALSEIADAALETAEADTAVVVMVAEAAGLVGASLRRAPTSPDRDRFEHPGIRKWISFGGEPAFAGSLCLVAGVVSRDPDSPVQKFLRPLGGVSRASGHFHAAAFPYQPLKKGRIDLSATVEALFERESVQGVLHLLADRREASGAGESEFARGACWAVPVTKVEAA